MSLRWLARQVEMPRMQLEMGNSGLGKNPAWRHLIWGLFTQKRQEDESMGKFLGQ